jgi:hypothetical protein
VPVRANRDRLHQSTVRDLAASRFNFPNDDYPDLETYVNVPEAVMGIGDEDLFPDIVVVRMPGKWFEMSAVVETRDSVTEENAREFWLPYSKMGDFFLFVPVGYAGKAKKICGKVGVDLTGLRTYRHQPIWGIEVNDVWPYPAMTALREPPIPGFIRKRLKHKGPPASIPPQEEGVRAAD